MAREARRTARELPLVVIVGLIAVVVAGVLDVVVHLSASDHAAHAVAHAGAVPEHVVHLIGIAGMVLVLAGVVTYGLRRQLRQRAAHIGGFDHDAHR